MVKFNKIMILLNFIYITFIKCLKYCGIGQTIYNVSFPPIRNNYDIDTNNFYPIRIYLDTSLLERMKSNLDINEYNNMINSLNEVVGHVEKLIKVKPLNYKIAIRNEDLKAWNLENINEDLKENNGVPKDLVVIIKTIIASSSSSYQASFEHKYIDRDSKRPIVATLTLNLNFDFDLDESNQYLKTMILHQFTHILGFYNQSFPNFQIANGDISKIITTLDSDRRSNVKREYIHSPKVMEYVKKYYGCDETIVGLDLEDQDGRTNSHWDARVLLGEYMNSEPYYPEQVISEFTLALLEDSGWYEINYYTGGLMRYGKHKGCKFLIDDCSNPSMFKNEFFNLDESSETPS